MPLQKSQSLKHGCKGQQSLRKQKTVEFTCKTTARNTFLNKFNAWAIKSDLGKVGTFPVNMSHRLPKHACVV